MIQRPVGGLIELQRRWIDVDPLETYGEIGVRSFGRGIFHKEPLTGDVLGSKRVLWIEPGDLVFNNVFAWEGAVALASERERGMIGSHRFMTYVARSDDVDLGWLRFFFISESGLRLLGHASPGSAGRNRTLAIERFEALEIPLPPIDEQRQIVARLESLLRQVETVSSVAARDEQLALITLPAVVDVVLGRWQSRNERVGDLVELVGDLVRPGDDPAPANTFVGLQHVESHSGRRIGETPIGGEKGRKFRFRPGDILYGYLRPYLNKVWVADRDGLCSVDQHVLRPIGDVPAEYIAYALRSRSTLDEAIRLTHSLQLPRLRSGLLLGLRIPVPESSSSDAALEDLRKASERVLLLDAALRRRRACIDALEPAALNRAFSFAA